MPYCRRLLTTHYLLPTTSSLPTTAYYLAGALYYPWGGGYSSLEGRMWRERGKLVISARASLWGEGATGTMLGVKATAAHAPLE